MAAIHAKENAAPVHVSAMLGDYLKNAPVASSDAPVVNFLRENLRVHVSDITVRWTDAWIKSMKRVEYLAPSSIRKRVESLGRALHWYYTRAYDPREMPVNPLKTLPRGYSAYRDGDAPCGKAGRRDVERDRRLAAGEETAIESAVLGAKIPNPRQFLLLLRVIVNTGLRLREAYCLRGGDIRFDVRTIHVSKSKTGTRRDVPMTKQVHDWLSAHPVEEGSLVFSFWDGDPNTLNATSNRLSHTFSRVFAYAGCENLTEHDLRHEATCRWMEMKDAQGRWLFRPEEVRKITGHRTERMFMRYLSLRGSDLAERLW